MLKQTSQYPDTELEIQDLHLRLAEAEETLSAIRNGEVDALVIAGPNGEQVYTLKGADYPYRQLVEEMSEGAVTLAFDGTLLYCNRRFAEMLRQPLEAVIGSSLHAYVTPDDHILFEALLQQAQDHKSKAEIRLEVGDEVIPVYLSMTPMLIDCVPTLLLLATDLTEHKRHQDIVAAERVARAILDQAVESIIVCNRAGQVRRANHAAVELCGANPVFRPFEEAFPLRELKRAGEPAGPWPLAWSDVLNGRRLQGVEVSLERAPGVTVPLLFSAAPLFNDQSLLTGCVVTLIDITGRKQTEEQLRQARDELEARVQERTQQLRVTNEVLQSEIIERGRIQRELIEMQRRLTESLEAERLSLAQDLHDGPVQELYAITYQLRNIGMTLDEGGQMALAANRAAIQRVIDTMRDTANELRPPLLTAFGLEKAIRSHAEHVGQQHPDLDFQLQLMPDGQQLPELVRLALFRIYQHGVSNILRHAQATCVAVRFELDAEQAVLEVRDDGRGFEMPARLIDLARAGHLGLIGAVERAESVGGRLNITSAPGAGTSIRATIPAKEEDVSVSTG